MFVCAACGADAWRRLRKNKLALAGLAVILIFLFMALFGCLLTPYDFLETGYVQPT